MAPEMQKNHFWSNEETIFMLQQLKELNILKFMDGRRTRNAHLFQKVAQRLKKAGFIRTAEQIRVRWKHVKQTYYAAKKKNPSSGLDRVVCPYSDILEELLGGRPLSQAGDHGADVGFSSESVAGVEDFEETTVEEQSPEAPSETDEDSFLSLPGVCDLASDRERSSSAPQLGRAASTPPVGLPGTRSQQAGRRRRTADVDLVFQSLEEMNNSWRQQLQQSEERVERLVNSIIESNATIVSALLEGIRSLRPAVAPQPVMPVKHEEHD